MVGIVPFFTMSAQCTYLSGMGKRKNRYLTIIDATSIAVLVPTCFRLLFRIGNDQHLQVRFVEEPGK